MGLGQQFERVIQNEFNEFFKSNNIQAIAKRIPQVEYHDQIFDVLVYSTDKRYYLALECKNIDISKNDFYLSRDVKISDVVEQISFCKLSGMRGLYCINLRDKRIHKTYVIPINSIFKLIQNKKFDEKIVFDNGGAVIREHDGKNKRVDFSYFNGGNNNGK